MYSQRTHCTCPLEQAMECVTWAFEKTLLYTSGQRYGITTTKWHLREFDQYLLFLVVCSITERSTVDFIYPLRNQIEWPNTVIIVWGPLRLKRMEKVSSGVVTWSEVCLAITTLMLWLPLFYAAWGFGKHYWYFFKLLKGIMPQNLPEQILQQIVRLLADGNSQREVARMLGVSEGCISKILRRNWETGRPHQRKRGGSMKISTPQEDRQLLRMVITNRFISAPRLRMQMIRRFGRRMSVQTIRRRLLATGYWSLHPARSPWLTWSTGDAAVGGGGGTECGTSDNGDTVSSVMSPGSPYTTVTVGSGCAAGEGRDWLMPASSLMMEIVARQSWYGVQSTMGRGLSWSWWMEPWTSIGTSRSWGIKCCHGQRGCLDVITLCTSKTKPRPIQYVTQQLFWTTGCWGHGLASSESTHEPNWACLGSNVSLDPRHGWTPSILAELNNAVRQAWAAVRPGWVRTLVESCQGSSGHQRRAHTLLV